MDDVISGFHVPSNGQVNPLDVTAALAKGAKAKGGQIFVGGRVGAIVFGKGNN